jgi:transcriptional regulator with XRE-family HTH domain
MEPSKTEIAGGATVSLPSPQNIFPSVIAAMPLPDDRLHKPNVSAIERLRKRHGFTRERLAAKAYVSINTLRKRLKGEPALMCTFAKLAKALNVTPDVLIRGYKPPPKPREPLNNVEAIIDKEFSEIDETDLGVKLVAALKRKLGTRSTAPNIKIYILAITEGNSVAIRLAIEKTYLAPLINAFVDGDLDRLKITSLIIPRRHAAKAKEIISELPGETPSSGVGGFLEAIWLRWRYNMVSVTSSPLRDNQEFSVEERDDGSIEITRD